MDLESAIRDIPDFPEPGILFRDITPLLGQPEALQQSIERMASHFRGARIDKVIGIESRGFVFGAPLAMQLGAGFVPVRKPGKLPGATIQEAYQLEYGEAILEIHTDAVGAGERVLICDDVLATGGTLAAAIKLASALDASIVGCTVLIEIGALGGREKLAGHRVESIIQY